MTSSTRPVPEESRFGALRGSAFSAHTQFCRRRFGIVGSALSIFVLFSRGESPRAIARMLNTDGVPGPGGRPWGDTTIRGHHERGTGILRNELYVGRLFGNRLRYVKDPDSGKRRSRLTPPT